jgi:2-oxoglutarate-Fe(II)-dependent oxygenase superfamily protein
VRIQLTRSGTEIEGGEDAIAAWRDEFDRHHCVRLPRLIEPTLVSQLQAKIEAAGFFEKTNRNIGDESRMAADPAGAVLEFLTNDAAFFEVVRAITGCAPIGCYRGRVYRLLPKIGHMSDWHTDLVHGRMATMSINLSSAPFEGGLLQIREMPSERIVTEVANIGAGDAVIFRIDTALQHRVTPTTGTTPRTAYAGWFLQEPLFEDLLRRRVAAAVV